MERSFPVSCIGCALDGPLIVLFEQNCADEPDDRVLIGKTVRQRQPDFERSCRFPSIAGFCHQQKRFGPPKTPRAVVPAASVAARHERRPSIGYAYSAIKRHSGEALDEVRKSECARLSKGRSTRSSRAGRTCLDAGWWRMGHHGGTTAQATLGPGCQNDPHKNRMKEKNLPSATRL